MANNESVFDINEGFVILKLEILEENSFFSKMDSLKLADKILKSSNDKNVEDLQNGQSLSSRKINKFVVK